MIEKTMVKVGRTKYETAENIWILSKTNALATMRLTPMRSGISRNVGQI